MTIAIVGGGLAGASCAAELRHAGHGGPITLYAAEPHPPYERPPLSKEVLLGQAPPSTATVFDTQWYRDHDIDLRLSTRVNAIDLGRHTVRAGSIEKSFTKLVLATGAVPRRFAAADASGRPVHYLRTLEDSQRLKVALAAQPRVTIVGGGWIGLEVAAAARHHGCPVTLHEQAPLPLIGVLGPEIAAVFADLHRSHGVQLRLGAPVTARDLADAELIVVGIGAVPDISLAETAGLAVHDGVLVDPQLLSSHPDVYAVGDIANHDHPKIGRRVRVEHWDTAAEQGKAAARNLLGAHDPYERQPFFFTDQYDLGMEYAGYVGPAGYDDVVIEGDVTGVFRAFWLREGSVVAAMHVNDWDAADSVKDRVGRRWAAPAA